MVPILTLPSAILSTKFFNSISPLLIWRAFTAFIDRYVLYTRERRIWLRFQVNDLSVISPTQFGSCGTLKIAGQLFKVVHQNNCISRTNRLMDRVTPHKIAVCSLLKIYVVPTFEGEETKVYRTDPSAFEISDEDIKVSIITSMTYCITLCLSLMHYCTLELGCVHLR